MVRRSLRMVTCWRDAGKKLAAPILLTDMNQKIVSVRCGPNSSE
jgi:hypothetical protein